MRTQPPEPLAWCAVGARLLDALMPNARSRINQEATLATLFCAQPMGSEVLEALLRHHATAYEVGQRQQQGGEQEAQVSEGCEGGMATRGRSAVRERP